MEQQITKQEMKVMMDEQLPEKIVIGDRIFDVRIEDNHWIFDNRFKLSDELFADMLMELADRAAEQDSIRDTDITKLRVMDNIELATVLYDSLDNEQLTLF